MTGSAKPARSCSWKASVERQGRVNHTDRRGEKTQDKLSREQVVPGGAEKRDSKTKVAGLGLVIMGLACKGSQGGFIETSSAMVTANSIWEAVMQGSKESSWQQPRQTWRNFDYYGSTQTSLWAKQHGKHKRNPNTYICCSQSSGLQVTWYCMSFATAYVGLFQTRFFCLKPRKQVSAFSGLPATHLSHRSDISLTNRKTHIKDYIIFL